MKIVIYGNEFQDMHVGNLVKLFDALKRHQIEVIVESKFYSYLIRLLPSPIHVDKVLEKDDVPVADIALSLGGDGTFLRAARKVAHYYIPVLGINTGTLGYLADINVCEISDVVDELASGKFIVEDRSLIELSTDAEEVFHFPYAVNEVAISKTNSAAMLHMEATIDGHPLMDCDADGLIIATPTGSTAYNLSVGGPIIAPVSRNIVITPIAAHKLSVRPIVLNNDCQVSVKTTSRADCYAVNIDGRNHILPINSTITLTRAPFPLKVVHRMNHHFTATLRNKLHWDT